jgi:hypothetical protein
MQTLKNFATSDPTFAGIGAYYSNVPMKVFMGSEPTVPLEIASKALDSMQSGKATPGDVAQVKHGLQKDHCSTSCLSDADAFCSQGHTNAAGGAAASDSQYKQCMQLKKAACSQQCAAVAQPPLPTKPGKPTGAVLPAH